jgi:hypothetical protein
MTPLAPQRPPLKLMDGGREAWAERRRKAEMLTRRQDCATVRVEMSLTPDEAWALVKLVAKYRRRESIRLPRRLDDTTTREVLFQMDAMMALRRALPHYEPAKAIIPVEAP